jgi:hypothetical protein
LPDFYLPDLDIHVEIKPFRDDWPDDAAYQKVIALSEQSLKQVVILCGEPGPVQAYGERNAYNGFIVGDNGYYWCECPYCGAVGIQFEGRSARNRHGAGCPIAESGKDREHNLDSPRITAAWITARSARFDHAANGAPCGS